MVSGTRTKGGYYRDARKAWRQEPQFRPYSVPDDQDRGQWRRGAAGSTLCEAKATPGTNTAHEGTCLLSHACSHLTQLPLVKLPWNRGKQTDGTSTRQMPEWGVSCYSEQRTMSSWVRIIRKWAKKCFRAYCTYAKVPQPYSTAAPGLPSPRSIHIQQIRLH